MLVLGLQRVARCHTEHEQSQVQDGTILDADAVWLNGVEQGRVPETTLKCIQHLRRHLPLCRISVEIEKPGRGGLRELVSEANVVFYSRSWAEVSLGILGRGRFMTCAAQHHVCQKVPQGTNNS